MGKLLKIFLAPNPTFTDSLGKRFPFSVRSIFIKFFTDECVSNISGRINQVMRATTNSFIFSYTKTVNGLSV